MEVAYKVLPDYSCPESRHDFTQPQLMVSLMIKRYLELSYRQTEDFLASSLDLAALMGLKEKTPDHSTLQKFFKRMDGALLDHLFSAVATKLKPALKESLQWAADSTGYRLTQASHHYLASRWKKREEADHPYQAKEHRKFAKHIFMVDLRWLLLGSQGARQGPWGDMGELVPLIKGRDPWMRVKAIAADPGFDTMKAHRWIRTRLHAKDGVKLANRRGDPQRIHPYRKRIRRYFPWVFYRQRSKAETIPSVIKRRFGNHILARSYEMRRKETLMLGVIYNIYRGIQLGFLSLFPRISWVFS